jgi:hypothetical protein
VQQDNNGYAVLTAKIYCTFVCFVELLQSILMYGGQRLKLKDTSREGAVTNFAAGEICSKETLPNAATIQICSALMKC